MFIPKSDGFCPKFEIGDGCGELKFVIEEAIELCGKLLDKLAGGGIEFCRLFDGFNGFS